MAEEWGNMATKASKETTAIFETGNALDGLEALAKEAGLDSQALNTGNGPIDEVSVKHGIVLLKYDCPQWARVSEHFVGKGKGIEYYARHGDEYGTHVFFALSESGARTGFEFDQDGDAMEDSDYQQRMIQNVNNWKDIVPATVKHAFPAFADVDAEDVVF